MTSDRSSDSATRDRSDPRFIIIGAGMAGLLCAIRLKQAGFDNFAIYEKADKLGGTWRENTYPGIACDVPSHFYSYSFAPNPEWTHRFSPGNEIQSYFESVARQYGMDARIQFGEEAKRCTFEGGRWQIEMASGRRDQADFVIAATGVLHHPAIPDIEGMDQFQGAAFHSARWDHDVAIDGRRIGVIGTGSSAIQIVTALASRASELTMFQRTAQWITPIENPVYSDADKANFRVQPEAMVEIRKEAENQFTHGFANAIVDAKSPIIQAIHDNCEAHLNNSVKDPVLREKLRPDYRATCKRLVMSDGFYEAIQHPNARLVTDGIRNMEPTGARTEDGQLHELDVLVLATGFQVDSFVRPMNVTGRDGIPLDEIWKKGPTAYEAISVPDFPNFFMVNGPNGPVGNFSLIEVAELQFNYIMQLVEKFRSGSCSEISVSSGAMERFDEERREAAKSTIWATGCKSWYLDESGLPTAWPWTFDRFREEMSQPRFDDYEMK